MFKELGGVQIQGGFFNTLVKPLFFHRPLISKSSQEVEKHKHISIVYGQNGSGKSSISQAIYEYSQPELDEYSNVELLDNDGVPIDRASIPLAQIFVFNEKFIHDEIRFTQDGKLNSIVLFGEQKKLDEQIDILESSVKELENNKIPLDNKEASSIEKILDAKKDEITRSLQKSWALREQRIKNNPGVSPVSKTAIDSIFSIQKPRETLDELNQKYEPLLAQLENTRTSKPIDTKASPILVRSNLDILINTLLSAKVDKPHFNEREQKIIARIEKEKSNRRVLEAKQIFSSEEIDSCPMCFQELSTDYKQHLLLDIENIFNSKAAQEHQDTITQFINTLVDITLNLECFELFAKELVTTIYDEIESYNQLQSDVRNTLVRKTEDIYTPILDTNSDLFERLTRINALLSTLEEKREEYNQTFKNASMLEAELKLINKKIAYIENIKLLGQWKTKEDEASTANAIVDENKKTLALLKVKIQELNAQKNNIDLAIKIIND